MKLLPVFGDSMGNNSKFTIAVHILTMLANARNASLKSDYVAKSINTNPVVVRRIWANLVKAGLIVSRTGSSGGARLTREASEITLLDVYRAVETECLFPVQPNQPNQYCQIGKNIQGVLEEAIQNAQQKMERALVEVTIADILKSVMSLDYAEACTQ